MEIKKLNRKLWCVCCDNDYAAYEISNNGGFRLFWACGPTDGEIVLCKSCFQKLKELVNSVDTIGESKYTGYWSFAPMGTPTIHTVEAKNLTEAEEKLIEWGFDHESCVDDPLDFSIEIVNPRHFVDEDGKEYDENELYTYWQMHSVEIEVNSGAETFDEYLSNCLSKNGTLKELK